MMPNKVEILQMLLQKPHNYLAAKRHSRLIDKKLGFRYQSIENQLLLDKNSFPKREFWIGLDVQALQTPFSEIVQMLEIINPKDGQRWIDLGAGYGRFGIVLGFLRKAIQFVGIEFVQQRVDEGNRILKKWKLDNSKLLQADLAQLDFDIESADLYFLYDFGAKADIYIVLEKIRKKASEKPIQVIARGRGVKNWILHDFPWLSQVHPPIHFETWSLFRS